MVKRGVLPADYSRIHHCYLVLTYTLDPNSALTARSACVHDVIWTAKAAASEGSELAAPLPQASAQFAVCRGEAITRTIVSPAIGAWKLAVQLNESPLLADIANWRS